jgi:cytochrome c oxidase cbb3-type subunit 3
MHLLFRLFLAFWLLAGQGPANLAHAGPEPALLTLSLPGRTMAQAIQDVKSAITSHNYTFVREQAIDSRLVPVDWEAKSAHIVYFCNFDKMNRALAIDVRAAQFLPCRITLLETRDGVDLVVVNPAWVSESMGNPLLHQDCLQLKADYLAILEEAAL